MITEENKKDISVCICPECKNAIDLTRYPNVTVGMVIECNHCGMTLLVKGLKDGQANLEIVDEGK